MAETPFALSKGSELWNINIDSNGNLQFRANSSTIGSTKMIIEDETGNVGIGTSSPRTKLEVNGNIALKTGSEVWNIRVDSSGNLRFRANSATSGVTRMFINNDSGNVGIGTISPSQKLHVIGNVCANSHLSCSDRRLKKNIKPLTNSLGKVLEMSGKRFEWRQEEFQNSFLGDGTQVGFISQEMEKVYPEAVTIDDEGFQFIDYSRLTPVLVEAVKEQQQLIEQQKTAIDKLQAKLDQLEDFVRSNNS